MMRKQGPKHRWKLKDIHLVSAAKTFLFQYVRKEKPLLVEDHSSWWRRWITPLESVEWVYTFPWCDGHFASFVLMQLYYVYESISSAMIDSYQRTETRERSLQQRKKKVNRPAPPCKMESFCDVMSCFLHTNLLPMWVVSAIAYWI